MASVRPLPPTPDELLAPVDHDQITEHILDAALAEFQEFGLRRASIDSVAERLGVGRMTVYRRFGGKDALAHAVMLRETKRYLDSVHHDIAGETVHSRIEEGFRAGVARNRE
jgi:AcrR family transcriptional regulator